MCVCACTWWFRILMFAVCIKVILRTCIQKIDNIEHLKSQERREEVMIFFFLSIIFLTKKVSRHFPDGQFPDVHLPDGHFPDRNFPDQTDSRLKFPRPYTDGMDISPSRQMPDGHFSD